MRRLGSITLVLCVGLAVMASASAWGAPGGLGALRTRDAFDLGPLTTGARSVTLVLAPRQPGELRARLAELGRGVLTPSEYARRFGPSPATVSAIRAWARAKGLSVASVSPNRLLVVVRGPVLALGRALGIAFDRFRSADGSTYVSSVGTAGLPHRLAADILSVLGLSDLGRARPLLHLGRGVGLAAAGGLSVPAAFGPQDLASLYHAPAAASGQGQTVAVIADGDVGRVRSDLVTFEQKFGLPRVPVDQITVGTPSSDASGADEFDLDTQYATGLAPNVSSLRLYDGPSLSDQDVAATINRWVTDDVSGQASFSAGECEVLASASGLLAGLDAVLAQAQAQGQTLFASSGDQGSFCPALITPNGVPAGIPNTNYPASSPHAIGVGGTTVLGPGPNEIAWYAGGGGASLLEAVPAFQQRAGGSFLGSQRGVPDVSLDADPNSGYRVIVAGQEIVAGGTSASAPAWQGIWARAQGAHASPLGFAGPVIYTTEPSSAFHDIVLGTNDMYPATPGYDYVTGRGTPDVSAFVAAVTRAPGGAGPPSAAPASTPPAPRHASPRPRRTRHRHRAAHRRRAHRRSPSHRPHRHVSRPARQR